MSLIEQALAQGISRLEAEILLTHVLGVERSALLAWPHQAVLEQDSQQFLSLISRRVKGEPIAYLTGKKEFWSLSFKVTPSVLIPRPETELVVELALKLLPDLKKLYRVLELGTGSGAIALALARERPQWSIFATDISQTALAVAQNNAHHLAVSNVKFYQGDWFAALSKLEIYQKQFDVILSNPPYLADHDPHLQQADLRFEPESALKAGPSGLEALKKIIEEARNYLAPKGWLILEHGFDQAAALQALFQANGYQRCHCYQDLAGLDRVTVG